MSRRPSAVRDMPRRPRTKRDTPSWDSSRFTRAVTFDWTRWRRSPARVTLPASATVLKSARSESSILRSPDEMADFMNIHFTRTIARGNVEPSGSNGASTALTKGGPMAVRTALTDRLGMRHPIIQAPLAGGGDTPELVAAVAEAGAFGFIGAAYLSPPQIVETAQAVRARTTRPFGVNLFAPLPAPAVVREPGPALACVAPFYAELGLPPPTLPAAGGDTFDEQLAAALDSGAAVFSFTFGLLPTSAMAAMKDRGVFLIGTVTTVEEAVALAQAGVDAIVTQGSEAGGHRSTFAAPFEMGM